MAKNPRVSNGHRRRELRKRVFARDTHCWAPFCRQPVDTSLPPGLDLSPEVHEIIPVSRGGDPLSPENTALCHRLCNRLIGNRTPAELARSNITKPTPTRTAFNW